MRGSGVAFFGGISSNPLLGEVESAVRRAGFGDQGIIVDQDFPWSNNYGSQWMLVAHHSVRSPWSVAATIGDGPLGTTHGYRDDGGWEGASVAVRYGVTFLGAEVRGHLNRSIAVGAGPALYRLRANCGGDCVSNPRSRLALGALADLGIAIRLSAPLRLEGVVQYRYTGSMDLGPWTAEGDTIAEFSADYSHIYAGLGLGLRF